MVGQVVVVIVATILVAAGGFLILQYNLPIGPLVLALSVIPLAGLRLSGRNLSRAIPDLIFGGIDTDLLAIPAVAGAVAGGVIGDALTDAIAGFFEGAMAEWLRAHGFTESREMTTASLGKMAGCLLGSGLVLTVALLLGVDLQVA